MLAKTILCSCMFFFATACGSVQKANNSPQEPIAETQSQLPDATFDRQTKTDGPESHVGRFMAYDLASKDPTRSAEFLSDLFQWEARLEGESWTLSYKGRHMGRMVLWDESLKRKPGWLCWVAVEDVEDSVRDVKANGGRVLFTPGRGVTRKEAIVRGRTGGPIGLLQPHISELDDHHPRPGDWWWAHLWTDAPAEAQNFYHTILGYNATKTRYGNTQYTVLSSDGQARGVIVKAPTGQTSRWIPVVLVTDTRKKFLQALELGAKSVVRPRAIPGLGIFASLEGPAGGYFGIISRPVEDI